MKAIRYITALVALLTATSLWAQGELTVQDFEKMPLRKYTKSENWERCKELSSEYESALFVKLLDNRTKFRSKSREQVTNHLAEVTSHHAAATLIELSSFAQTKKSADKIDEIIATYSTLQCEPSHEIIFLKLAREFADLKVAEPTAKLEQAISSGELKLDGMFDNILIGVAFNIGVDGFELEDSKTALSSLQRIIDNNEHAADTKELLEYLVEQYQNKIDYIEMCE